MFFSDDDENEEIDMHARKAALESSPLYQKAREILEIVMAINKTVTRKEAEHFVQCMIDSAMIIPAKIAGAFHSDSWVICMENASLVRHHAQFLLTSTSSMDLIFDLERDYADVLRRAMFQFRDLFIAWTNKIHLLEKNEWDEDEWLLYRRE